MQLTIVPDQPTQPSASVLHRQLADGVVLRLEGSLVPDGLAKFEVFLAIAQRIFQELHPMEIVGNVTHNDKIDELYSSAVKEPISSWAKVTGGRSSEQAKKIYRLVLEEVSRLCVWASVAEVNRPKKCE